MNVRLTPICQWLFILIALLFLVVAASHAQTCPVLFTEAHITHGDIPVLGVGYINISNKHVTGSKFRAKLFDAVNEPHITFEHLISDKSLAVPDYTKLPAPRHSAYDEFDLVLYGPFVSHNGGEVWVEKVVFADGTYWQDDGSHLCHTKIETLSE